MQISMNISILSRIIQGKSPSKQIKLCPFVFFRETEDDAGESDEEENGTLVASYFDGAYAKKLYSNGKLVFADSYEKDTTTGYVLAHWLDDKTTMQLEIPNDLISEKGDIMQYRPPDAPAAKVPPKPAGKVASKPAGKAASKKPKKKGKGKAKSKRKKAKEEAEEKPSATEVAEVPVDKPTWDVYVRPGHGTAYTIMMKSHLLKETSQILVVTTKQAPSQGPFATPLRACEHIIEEIKKEFTDFDISATEVTAGTKFRDTIFLDAVKKCAVALRDKLPK